MIEGDEVSQSRVSVTHEGSSNCVMEELTRIGSDLECCTKKLTNVHMLIMHLRAWDDDHDAFIPISFEKSLEFELLSGILESEVIEMGQVMKSIEEEIAVKRDNYKIQSLEQSLCKSMTQFLEVKMQSTKLHRTFSDFRANLLSSQVSMNFASDNHQVSKGLMLWKKMTAEQQLQGLRLYEKSLSRELVLEKQLLESRRNEELLKNKLSQMEQMSEAYWGIFLEAENKAEIFEGISKDLVSRFQKSVVEKDQKAGQLPILEEQLRKYELHVKNTIDLNAKCQEQLHEMEGILVSLKDNLNEAETRADLAEAKVADLTDTNLELSEELNDVKSSRDDDLRKASLLETQMRELEIQLQHLKASAEANQEQQNMLYSAIWDMETLIEDLKAKLSVSDIKAAAAEEHCKRLSKANLDLHTEIGFLKSKVSMLEESLSEADKAKELCAREINLKAQILMDSVMQLAKQREFIQTQLFTPIKKKGRKVIEKGIDDPAVQV